MICLSRFWVKTKEGRKFQSLEVQEVSSLHLKRLHIQSQLMLCFQIHDVIFSVSANIMISKSSKSVNCLCFDSQLIISVMKVSWCHVLRVSYYNFWKSADCLSFESQLMLCFEGKLMLFFKISWLFMFSKSADIMFWKSADCLSFSESANCICFESQLTIQLIIYFSKVSWYHGVTESQLIVNVTVKSPF